MRKRYIQIKLNEFDELLKTENGWERNIAGKEYVYDYNPPLYPKVIIKVLSSITEGDNVTRSCGKDAIRVFAVVINEAGSVLRGLTKSRRVYRTKNWRDNVKQAYIETLELVKKRT
jgi:hypothetical protein